jgi:hypothetical protein
MSREGRSLRFGVTVDKVEYWPVERRDEADACAAQDCNSYADHAVHLLTEAILEAAAAWHAANPGLLACEPS